MCSSGMERLDRVRGKEISPEACIELRSALAAPNLFLLLENRLQRAFRKRKLHP